MQESSAIKAIKQELKDQAKYIAIVVRNSMEDFHCEHLNDKQMKELNPIIRNAIYTALYSMVFNKDSDKADRFLKYHNSMIPNYWEDPELLGKLDT